MLQDISDFRWLKSAVDVPVEFRDGLLGDDPSRSMTMHLGDFGRLPCVILHEKKMVFETVFVFKNEGFSLSIEKLRI